MPESKWRKIAAPIISDVIKKHGLEDEKKLRKALREAYPFGERAFHPYKIWLDEIARQTGKKKPNIVPKNPNQKELF